MNQLETKRQIIHASGLLISFYILWAGWKLSVITMSLILVSTALISETHKRGINIPLMSLVLDNCERPDVIEERPAKGALLFFVGSMASLILFKNNLNIVSASIIILAMGDSVSTLIGKKFGKHKIPYNKMKSIEGSFSGFVFALLGAQIFVKFPIAIIGAFSAMFAESLPISIDDNISIPIISGMIMTIALFLL